MGLLDGELKTIIGDATSFLFLDYVLVRKTLVEADDPWNPPTEIETEYSCKAIVTRFKRYEIDDDKVLATDNKILFLANSLSVEPAIDDLVYRSGETRRYKIVAPVRKDPAGATVTAQAR